MVRSAFLPCHIGWEHALVQSPFTCLPRKSFKSHPACTFLPWVFSWVLSSVLLLPILADDLPRRKYPPSQDPPETISQPDLPGVCLGLKTEVIYQATVWTGLKWHQRSRSVPFASAHKEGQPAAISTLGAGQPCSHREPSIRPIFLSQLFKSSFRHLFVGVVWNLNGKGVLKLFEGGEMPIWPQQCLGVGWIHTHLILLFKVDSVFKFFPFRLIYTFRFT